MSPAVRAFLWRRCARVALAYLRRAATLAPEGYRADLAVMVASLRQMVGDDAPNMTDEERASWEAYEAHIAATDGEGA